MDPALWVAKTGVDAQQTRMAVISNNLANVNTSAFKRDRAVFEDLLYRNVRQVGAQSSQDTQIPTGLSVGTGVRAVATEKVYTQGNLVQTNNNLDLAVQGQATGGDQLPLRILNVANFHLVRPIRQESRELDLVGTGLFRFQPGPLRRELVDLC